VEELLLRKPRKELEDQRKFWLEEVRGFVGKEGGL
jgi:hypothetical protein